ncbi:MAG TPA: outer membrane beta-barrel protein [Polyangiales bacterium]|nr:outer membrane beta-barrel protein [Polyangiales bacterium]
MDRYLGLARSARFGALAMLGVCFLLSCSSALAQERSSERGRFKLYVDANLFGYRRNLIEFINVSDADFDSDEYVTNNVFFGPFSGGGIGAGYAVTSWLVPELYLSLLTNFSDPSVGTASYSVNYSLSPQVELVRPRGRFAPFATAGLAFVGSKFRRGEFELGADGSEGRGFRFGPALSVGFHSFLVARAALDFSLRFNATFLMRANGASVDEPKRNRQFDLLVMMGSSFWL